MPGTVDSLAGYKPRVVASLWTMFFLVFKRSMVQHARSKMSFVIDNLLIFIASLFLALVYFNNPVFIAPEPEEVKQIALRQSALRVVDAAFLAVILQLWCRGGV